MIIEEALLKQLLATSAITALVGQRVHYVTAPQDVETPYIVIQNISDVPGTHRFDAASGASSARIQITVIGLTYYSCKQIAAAVKTAINGYKGTLGGSGGLAVGACLIDSDNDIPYESNVNLYGVAVDYTLYYN